MPEIRGFEWGNVGAPLGMIGRFQQHQGGNRNVIGRIDETGNLSADSSSTGLLAT